MDAFFKLGELPPQTIWEGIAGRVVHGERLTLGVIELDPDAVIPEHRHANEQLGIMLHGSMRFRIADETRELRPGDIWRIPGDVPHAVEVGPEGAVVVDVFAPPRSDWAELAPGEPRPPRWP